MMIVTVARKRNQDSSAITFNGDLVFTDTEATDYHINITAINCDEPDCKIVKNCKGIVFPCGAAKPNERQLIHNGQCATSKETKASEEPEADQGWVLLYTATGLDGCELTFEWCDLLWNLPAAIYDAVLYRNDLPCGRFRIQLRTGRVWGADKTQLSGCAGKLNVE